MSICSDLSYEVQALLFDMDGTLVDSSYAIKRVWQKFADIHRLDVNKILSIDHGKRTEETIASLALSNIDVNVESDKLTTWEIDDCAGIKAIAGAKAILDQLSPNRWAVVTSASKQLALNRMKAAGLPIPKVFITADDVTNGKPAPDGYLQAARLLSVEPHECMVLEDSAAGLQAAANAGMKAFAIGNNLNKADLGNYEEELLDYTKIKLIIPELDSQPIIITVSYIDNENSL